MSVLINEYAEMSALCQDPSTLRRVQDRLRLGQRARPPPPLYDKSTPRSTSSPFAWGASLLVGRNKADHAHKQWSAFSGVTLYTLNALLTTCLRQLTFQQCLDHLFHGAMLFFGLLLNPMINLAIHGNQVVQQWLKAKPS